MGHVSELSEEQLKDRFKKQIEDMRGKPAHIQAMWITARKQEFKSIISKLQTRIDDIMFTEVNDLKCKIEVAKDNLRVLEQVEQEVNRLGIEHVDVNED